jgi:flagellin
MALYIQTNVSSLEAQRNLAKTQGSLATTMQRLSSGYRINTAADDASGMAISENMQAQIRSYSVAERNTNNAISMSQVAEGALGQISGILGRMRELAVQGSNGDLGTTDRSYLNTEFGQLQSEIDRISSSTTFNGQALLSGTAAAKTFQVGIGTANSDKIDVTFGGVDAAALAVDSGTIDVTGADASKSQAAITKIDAAIATVSTNRANFGAAMNRLTVTVANTQSLRTNLSAANSRIKDVDVAEETANLARQNVLAQAGAAILSQANQAPQLAQNLLRG